MTDPFLEGKKLAKQGDFESALPLLRSASETKPESPDVWLALAACYFRLGRNDDFRESIRNALEIDPNHLATLRYLRNTTGGSAIPAPETGREKIFIEEERPICARNEIEETESRSQGCLSLVCIGFLIFSGIGWFSG